MEVHEAPAFSQFLQNVVSAVDLEVLFLELAHSEHGLEVEQFIEDGTFLVRPHLIPEPRQPLLVTTQNEHVVKVLGSIRDAHLALLS